METSRFRVDNMCQSEQLNNFMAHSWRLNVDVGAVNRLEFVI